MAEYKRVREQALLTDEEMGEISGLFRYDKPAFREIAQAQLDKALKADGIEIKSDDQSLPEIMCRNAQTELVIKAYDLAQQEMKEAGFIKVAPKEE